MNLKAEKTAILFNMYQNEFLSESRNLDDSVKESIQESNVIKDSVDLCSQQAITRSRAANSKKEVETKANQQTTTTTSECFNVCHQKYF